MHFTPVASNVVISNVNLAIELENLSYFRSLAKGCGCGREDYTQSPCCGFVGMVYLVRATWCILIAVVQASKSERYLICAHTAAAQRLAVEHIMRHATLWMPECARPECPATARPAALAKNEVSICVGILFVNLACFVVRSRSKLR